MAEGQGFEPRSADPESAVLPLDDPSAAILFYHDSPRATNLIGQRVPKKSLGVGVLREAPLPEANNSTKLTVTDSICGVCAIDSGCETPFGVFFVTLCLTARAWLV